MRRERGLTLLELLVVLAVIVTIAAILRDAKILDQGFATAEQKQSSHWLADYVLLTWGPGGKGTLQDPYWRWPGTTLDSNGAWKAMALVEVRRPSETLQWADGFTGPNGASQLWAHRNAMMNGAFADGHVARIKGAEWDQVDRDAWGYFYHLSAADR
jgi:prepilin-type N-terminal cleavage/methylation domain-containing protein/prepilin-type processing-associated H-X9-DG protein